MLAANPVLVVCAGLGALAAAPAAQPSADAAPMPRLQRLPAPAGAATAAPQGARRELRRREAGYELCVSAGSVAFAVQPAPGRSALPPLRFTLSSLGRRSAPAAVDPRDVRVETRGSTVDLVRPQVVERYELRADHVEQSFVFDQLPAGRGDLVVRGRIATDLPLQRSDATGVVFALPGRGGIQIGAVVGVDARGRRAPGRLQLRGGELELSLPAAFVDAAALPLVLDPPIGPVTRTAPYPVAPPDIAYDSTHDTYLHVWSDGTGKSFDTRGQLLDALGVPRGQPFLIQQGVAQAAVAGVAGRDEFVVVWFDDGVVAVTVSAATGAVSQPVTLAAPGFLGGLAVGGDTAGEDSAVVVWLASDGAGHTAIDGAVLQLAAASPPSFGLPARLASGLSLVDRPAIAKSGGDAARYLITWSDVAPGGDRDVQGMVVAADLSVLARGAIAATADEERQPCVDGDGSRWVVGYDVVVGANTSRGRACRAVAFDAANGALAAGPQMLEEVGPEFLTSTESVSWLGESALVGYIVRGPGLANAFVSNVDPFSCGSCEGVFVLESGGGKTAADVRMASRFSGDSTARDDALMTWRGTDFFGGLEFRAVQRYLAFDGRNTGAGGGCGEGGTAHATCALIGNAGFALRVEQARPMAPAWVLIAARRLDFPCGPCTIVPDPGVGVVFPATGGLTDALGRAALTVPLPNSVALSSATFYQQWLILSGGCFGFDLSSGLEVQIN